MTMRSLFGFAHPVQRVEVAEYAPLSHVRAAHLNQRTSGGVFSVLTDLHDVWIF